MSSPHRVVIVGAGFGGLTAAQKLNKAAVRITIIDQRNHHLFQPLLYQVATAALATSEIAWPIRFLMRKRAEVTTLLGTVAGVDPQNRCVNLEDGAAIAFDTLVLATGARHAYFGHDDWEPFAPGLKTLEDATSIRRRVLLSLERAEREDDPARRAALLTFAIVGGGPTGVELAGQIRELAYRSLTKDFRNIDPSTVRVILVDGGKEPLATFGGELSGRARKELERMGVELRMGLRVVGVDPFGVDTEGAEGTTGRVDCGTVIWAAGVQASPLAGLLAEATGDETDRAGRIAVLPDLSLPGHPEVFAIGDMATLNNLPGVCEVAMQGGLHAANTIKRRLKGNDSVPFKYRDLGSAAAIGRFKAIVSVKGLRLSGFPGFIFFFQAEDGIRDTAR
jgi:NADH dehydrogenase